ncbi:hypothetical protein KAR91_25475 [Candidatus Pacearchaeota archaeon]|nr:hypothetical protein [Candidatus Pacearchaeota archaeon]
MIISQLNSIRFRPVNSDLPNFDNTFVIDEGSYNDKVFTYCARWPNTTTQTIQIKTTSDTLPTAVATKADKSTVNLTVTEVSSYDTDSDGTDDTWYFEFTIDFSVFTTETFVTVTQSAIVYKSEPFIGDADVTTEVTDGELLKIEYYNFDNAFNLDFSTGLTFEIYIPAILKKYTPAGDKEIYDNQRELTTIKATKQRTLELRTLEIPKYLAETIDLITGLDNVVINDIAYEYEEGSIEVEDVEGSNFVTASAVLTDKEYLGINSSDIGFNCDVAPTEAAMAILTELAASGSVTFTIPEGYLVHTLRAQWVSGSSVEVKLGTSVGGDQLVYPRDIDSVDTDRTTAIHGDIDRDADTDIYATVTGGVANLDLQLIQNKETGT